MIRISILALIVFLSSCIGSRNLGEFMKYHEVDNLMVYASGNRGPKLNEIMTSADLNNIIMIRNVDHPYYGFPNIFTVPGYIPPYLENIKNAITVDTKGQTETNFKRFNRSTTNIGGTPASANTRIEKMELAISSQDNMLDVKRRSVVRGHYKSVGQQNLVLFEDYYNSERKYFNDDKDLIERLSDGRKTKKFAEELEAAFAEARKNNKEAFLSEAKSFFELDVTDMSDYKVENIGARHTSPDFIYSSQFKLSGIIKKAGSSYIIDIGKLQGSQLKIEGDQRNRSLDVYSPFARSLQYQIILKIPEGYTAEGLEALNKKVENATGAFISQAVVEGSSINLSIMKIYRNAYESSANWKQMLAFIDAAAEFSNAKILFKKK